LEKVNFSFPDRPGAGMKQLHGIVILLAALLVVSWTGSVTAQKEEIAVEAKKVFIKHCYKCHGKGGVATAGLHVLKWQQLTGADGYVVKNNLAKSTLYEAMASGVMPPEDDERVTELPTEDELAIVKRWIKGGAPTFEEEVIRKFISTEDVLARIKKDLVSLGFAAPSTRYFTLTHLYNAGVREDELITYRIGLSKLLNSLSWHPAIKTPVPIDPEYTIYRIDLRDYKWDKRFLDDSPDVWDAIVARNPYNIKYEGLLADAIYATAEHEMPFVRADWFVASASRPPLYHQILEIPETERELEKRLGIDVARNIETAQVIRAGFTKSGVSDNNRLIERHKSPFGAYWKSYDFSGNQGRQLLTSFPLGPGKEPDTFLHDGSEIIFNLPNGLQAYMLSTADGKRIDRGPTNIVRDPDDIARTGGAVVNGISCMHCHDQGMIRKKDEIRAYAFENPIAFEGKTEVLSTLVKIYKIDGYLDRFFDDDARRHNYAAYKAGSPAIKNAQTGKPQLVDGKPIVRLATQFHNALDLRLASAETGVEIKVFVQALGENRFLAQQLGLLKSPGKTVKRDTFVAAMPMLTQVLELGKYFPPAGTVEELALERASGVGTELAKVNLTGIWKSSRTGNSFQVQDNGIIVEVALLESDEMASLKGVLQRQGVVLTSSVWECEFKRFAKRIYQGDCKARITGQNTISLMAPFFFTDDNGKLLRTIPKPTVWVRQQKKK
jgi:mono/diheme cytochrome c family protein